MTFSIVAKLTDEAGDSWGVAVASKFLAVGCAVPAAVAGVGALATQAAANVAYKGEGIMLLDEGAPAEVALARLLADDPGAEHRQVGIIDLDGNAATHTGRECFDWAGGRSGPGYAVQGNILAGEEVVAAIESAWLDATGPIAHRLLAALRAGDQAGGDRRGRQSAALLVVREGAGYDGGDDLAVDLRVDDHPDPCGELARLVDLHDLYLTASTEAEKVPVDADLRAELEALAREQDAADLPAWVGRENFEMRVADDGSWIDRVVLARLRGSDPADS